MGSEQIQSVLALGLEEALATHHEIYRLPATAEYLEELVSRSFHAGGHANDWAPNRSHAVSTDMRLTSNDLTVSVKSGAFNPRTHMLTFSGSRLGRCNSLAEMLKVIHQESADMYVCVARVEADWTPIPTAYQTKKYQLFVFSSSQLAYEARPWRETRTARGKLVYRADDVGFEAKIVETMSFQLWTTVSTNIVGTPKTLVIPSQVVSPVPVP